MKAGKADKNGGTSSLLRSYKGISEARVIYVAVQWLSD